MRTASHIIFWLLFSILSIQTVLYGQESSIKSQALDHYNRGITLFEQKKYEEALDEYRQALNLNPEFSDAWNNQGIALMRLQNYAAAIDSFQKAILHKHEHSAEIYLNLAYTYTQQGDMVSGLKSAHQALEKGLEGELKVRALFQIGTIHFKAKQFDEALQYFRKIVDDYPKNTKALFNMGIIYYAQNQFDEALKSYTDAIKSDKNFARKSSLVHLHLGIIYLEKHDYQKAIAHFKIGYKINEELRFLPALARAYEALNQPQNALKILSLLVKKEPLNIQNNKLLADFYFRHSEDQDSLRVYLKVLELEPEPDTQLYTNLGALYYRLGHYRQAEEVYRKVLNQEPSQSSIQTKLGNVLFTQGNYDSALDAYEKAAEIDPAALIPQFNVAQVLLKMNKPEAAAARFESLLQKDNEMTIGYCLGTVLVACGRNTEAIAIFKKTLLLPFRAILPDTTAVVLQEKIHEALAFLYLHQNQVSDAITEFNSILKLNPEHAGARHNLVILNYQGSDLRGMPRELERLLRSSSPDPLILYNLGNVLFKLREFEQAVTAYKKALKLKPDYLDAHYNMGCLYLEESSFAKAAQAFQATLQYQNPKPEYYYNYGIALFGLEDYEGALNAFRQVQGTMKNSDLKKYLNLTLTKLGDKHRKHDEKYAVSLYTEALTYDQENIITLNNLGLTYYQSDQMEKAEELFRRALTLAPEYVPAHNNLAILWHASKQDLKMILKELEKAYNIPHKFPATILNLGLLYDRDLKDYVKALSFYEEYVALNGENKEIVNQWIQQKRRVFDNAVD
ncbi:tetratricopeptide repeat protein [candidate division CSSED10-310 bacterium]|uniref:Tetratricopeptide repeat protein n=1 Tax=candidate division CSSED10-310 bacterium TaxID=2855610 RepID=A0ABV6Z0Y5_UNCC1